MKEIYKEMLIADQWLEQNPEKREIADTTWFYKPIFEKHGYTIDDYYHTIYEYLGDPKRFGELMRSLGDEMSAEAERLLAEQRRFGRLKLDDHGKRKEFMHIEFPDPKLDVVTLGYEMKKNADSIWYPEPIVDDTIFSGPEIIIQKVDTASVPVREDDGMLFRITESPAIEKILLK